jgi:hypothetical protein
MKKSLVVLLVLALAASSVFAAVSGYVDAKYQIDFDKGNFGYKQPQNNLKASIKFDDHIGKKTGEGKVYIDAAASFTWNADEKKKDDGSRFVIDQLGYFKLSLDKLMVVGPDWTLNLKAAEKLGGYAQSTLDFHTWYRHDHWNRWFGVNDGDVITFMKDGVEYELTAKDDFADYQKRVAYSVLDPYSFYNDDDEDAGMNGVTFQWKGYKLALAINGHMGDQDNFQDPANYYMAVESADIAPIDGLTLKAAIGASYRDSGWKWDRLPGAWIKTDHTNTWLIAGSLKASYKSDKFNVDFATDHVLQTNPSQTPFNYSDDPKYYGATSVNGKIAPVMFDVFFSNNAISKKGSDKIYVLGDRDSGNGDYVTSIKKYYFSAQQLDGKNTVENLLSVQLGMDLQEMWEKVPVSVRVQGLNVMSDYRIINAFVDTTLLDGSLKLSVYGKDLLASFDKVNVDNDLNDGDYYGKFQSDMGSFNYWDENGSKQKIGVDATYLLNDAITVNGGLYAQMGDAKVGGNVGATYKADIFTANASVAGEFDYYNKGDNIQNASHNDQAKLQAKASVVSDKVVDGAVLSLTYESGNILDTANGSFNWYIGQQAGKLTAKCRVNF